MSSKKRDFLNGNFYHIFNKTVDSKTPFLDTSLCNRFLLTVFYYRASDLQLSFSKWKRLDTRQKSEIKKQLNNTAKFRVQIISYCLMPNHFHFILKQSTSDGIHDFISNITNSFTRAYNTQHERKGPLFLSPFHDVPITTEQQLLNVSRYVHRNPIAHKATFRDSFREYPWSSYKDYLGNNPDLLALTYTEPVLKYFNNDLNKYKEFVEDDFH